MEFEKKKKSEGKMVRAERQVVLDMLFSAFEKHQFYSFKDLVDITKQPVVSTTRREKHLTQANKGALNNTSEKNPPENKQYTCPLSTLLC